MKTLEKCYKNDKRTLKQKLTDHTAVKVNARWAGPSLAQWACLNWGVLHRIIIIMANNVGKWAGMGASRTKNGLVY